MKKVYIIIPIYNTEKYLRDCLDSVFGQTYSEIVVICVNDGSTDNSLNILLEYKKSHDKLLIISKTNGGLSSARNYGLNSLDYTQNNYIMFLDSDDCLEKDYVKLMVDFIEKTHTDIVCSSFSFFKDAQYKPCKISYKTNMLLSKFEALKLLVEDRTIQSHAWSKLYRMNLWREVRFPENIRYMEDQATTFKLFALANNNIYIVNNFGYLYRQNESSLCATQTKLNSGVINSLIAYRSVCEYAYKGFSESERESIIFAARQAFANVYLMMLPRFNKSGATTSEKAIFREMKEFIRKNKIIRHFIPKSKSERIKKNLYIFVRPLYSPLFRLYLRKK